MFKFDFDLDDLTDANGLTASNDEAQIPDPNGSALPGNQADHKPNQDPACMTIPITELIYQLPPFITYSNLRISPEISIHKRELYDAKFQTLVKLTEDEEDTEEEKDKEKADDECKRAKNTLDSLQSTSDLIPGVYEGGFKTWECSLDLAGSLGPIFNRLKAHFLAQNNQTNAHPRPPNEEPQPCRRTFTILELGCGTAIPTASLCLQLFGWLLDLNHHHSSAKTDRPACETDNQEPPLLELILQDFNSDVLKLLTFPNILLAFYKAKCTLEYRDRRRSTAEEPESEEEGDEEREEDVEITDELKTEFEGFLKENRIRLTMIYGPWSTFEIPGRSEGMRGGGPGQTCDVILSSETLYSVDSIPAFIQILMDYNRIDASHQADGDAQSTILVASKSIYFGVGGGTHSFIKALENFNGSVSFQDLPNHSLTSSNGVSRALMNVKFAS